jgi:hypothetical protein
MGAAAANGVVLMTYNTGISFPTNGGQSFTDIPLFSAQPGNPARTSFFPQSDGAMVRMGMRASKMNSGSANPPSVRSRQTLPACHCACIHDPALPGVMYVKSRLMQVLCRLPLVEGSCIVAHACATARNKPMFIRWRMPLSI